jgi:hypothetical protein
MSGMMLVLAIPSTDDGKLPLRVLTGIQYGMQIAFPVGNGKFAKTDVTFVYRTKSTPDRDRIAAEVARHVPEKSSPDAVNTYCSYCHSRNGSRPIFPCLTVRTLTGIDEA